MERQVSFPGKAGPSAGNVLAQGLNERGIFPDGAVRVDVGDLFP